MTKIFFIWNIQLVKNYSRFFRSVLMKISFQKWFCLISHKLMILKKKTLKNMEVDLHG